MNFCPVMNDLFRHLAEEDVREARAEAIRARADEIIESGDLDALLEQLSVQETDRLYKALAVIFCTDLQQSIDRACKDIREVMRRAARVLAEKQLKDEADAAAVAACQDRYEAWA